MGKTGLYLNNIKGSEKTNSPSLMITVTNHWCHLFWSNLSINIILRKVQNCHFQPTFANWLPWKANYRLFLTPQSILKGTNWASSLLHSLFWGLLGFIWWKKWSKNTRAAQKLIFRCQIDKNLHKLNLITSSNPKIMTCLIKWPHGYLLVGSGVSNEPIVGLLHFWEMTPSTIDPI